jgi:selenocysteine lyase/cysteine desulfurase
MPAPSWTRRAVLVGAASLAATRAAAGGKPVPPAAPVDDGDLWREVEAAFDLDRTMINLNNGGCSPSPRVVHQALERDLDRSNLAPSYFMWRELEPGVEAVRRDLAAEAGCDPEELAITRNASEALQIAQCGIRLSAGDEVVISDQDYPRMRTTWDQRARRDAVAIKTVSFPAPLRSDDELVAAYAAAITPRTRVLHVSHAVFLTGEILPVAKICALARERGVISIVDGAHAFAHVPVDLRAIGCDYYGTSLHKWLLAPVGTGFLYVRRERIPETWPLQAAPESMDANIRKFEEIGTHPAAAHNAVSEALAFHRAIGGARKHARLVALRRRWTSVLGADPRFRVHTSDAVERSGAIALVEVLGKPPGDVVGELWSRARIFATPIEHAQFRGVRVSPNVYTRMEDLDLFVRTMQAIAG